MSRKYVVRAARDGNGDGNDNVDGPSMAAAADDDDDDVMLLRASLDANRIHDLLGTVIVHMILAIENDQKLGRALLDLVSSDPSTLLSPFTISLLFSVARIQQFRDMVYPKIAQAIRRDVDYQMHRLEYNAHRQPGEPANDITVCRVWPATWRAPPCAAKPAGHDVRLLNGPTRASSAKSAAHHAALCRPLG